METLYPKRIWTIWYQEAAYFFNFLHIQHLKNVDSVPKSSIDCPVKFSNALLFETEPHHEVQASLELNFVGPWLSSNHQSF